MTGLAEDWSGDKKHWVRDSQTCYQQYIIGENLHGWQGYTRIHGTLFWDGQQIWLKFYMLIIHTETNQWFKNQVYSTFLTQVIKGEF